MPVFAVTIIGRLMPVLPEKREAGGFVRESAFYNGSAGPVPTKFCGWFRAGRKRRG